MFGKTTRMNKKIHNKSITKKPQIYNKRRVISELKVWKSKEI